MAQERISKTGVAKDFKNDKEAQPNQNRIVMGLVVNNVDDSHSGKITVQLLGTGSASGSETQVEYLSPFLGTTSPGGSPTDGPDKTGEGKFVGNPQSFGFWSGAPDVGTQVLCIFDEKGRGYYIGSVPKPGMVAMVPAIGSSDNVVPNGGEASTYGGADRLPTTEMNASNPANKDSAQPSATPKPVHSYQAGILATQGLIRDNVRGVIGSSAQRESPSRVYGMSTPGSAIYEGGFDASSIAAAAAGGTDKKKLAVKGRTGGHTFVMDDGTIDGQDQLVRLRTSGGHQIMMNDSGQALFIIHSNGMSWIELGKEGTIDMFSTNSFNVRTQGDLNLHADNDVNINANKKLNLFGQEINIESEKDSKWRIGGKFSGYSMGNYTFKVDGSMGIQSAGESGINSSGTLHLNGSKINMNSGTKGPAPASVTKMTKTSHIETTFSTNKGWMFPAPEALKSVTSRAPTHQPWAGSGSGVNVKVNNTAPSSSKPQTTPAVDAANKATKSQTTSNSGTSTTNNAPQLSIRGLTADWKAQNLKSATGDAEQTTSVAITSAAEFAAAPAAQSGAGPLPPEAVKAMTAQIATTAQSLTEEQQKAAGVINPASGLTASQMEAAGAIPPGAGEQVSQLIAKGMSATKALAGKLTGFGGVTDETTAVTDVTKQASIVQGAIGASAESLQSAGVLTGNESGMQAGGPILAGVTNGIKNVTNLLSDKAESVGTAVVAGSLSKALGVNVSTAQISSLKDSLMSGKLAAGLGEKLNGATAGLQASLEGMGDKLKGEMDDMKTGLQNAFASVEKSFPDLKGGVVNKLGKPGEAPTPKSPTETAGQSYDSAKADYESAETEWFNAKRDYSYSKSDEDYERIGAAEKRMSEAKQAMTKASTAFLKSMPGAGAISSMADSVSSGAGGLLDKAKAAFSSTSTSGINALPGGAGALMAKVNNSGEGGSNPLDKIKSIASEGASDISAKASAFGDKLSASAKGAADKIGDQVKGKMDDLKTQLSDPGKLAGQALDKVGPKLEGAMAAKLNSLIPGAGLGAAAAKGMMAELKSGLGAIAGPGAELKSPLAASGTFDVASLKAKMGSLFGDSKIPVPSFSDSVKPSAEAEKMTEEVSAALEKVKEAEYKVNGAKLNLRLTKESPFLSGPAKEQELTKATESVTAAELDLIDVRKAYSDVLNKKA